MAFQEKLVVHWVTQDEPLMMAFCRDLLLSESSIEFQKELTVVCDAFLALNGFYIICLLVVFLKLLQIPLFFHFV